ncbi:hypothetical protein [Candidatus Oleimmundimicrobium sp.]|uniref:hypothetical protein n=1 Tax=Candidatus Oleimmundimicrobium sp. TaxID=3060597 RepID=UPI0027208668|nr:hypothetical protein [Candidatus Oleimmundimicrobium sp.]MDO8886693.1 hypothetical protein [Candidatus Oleimmundimicrobium sp.]
MEEEFDKVNIYSILKESMVKNIENSIKTDEVMEKIISTSVSEEWLKNQIHLLLLNTYNYLKGKNEEIELKIPLSEVKAEIKKNLSDEIENLIPPEIKDNPQEVEAFKSNFETQISENIDAGFPNEIDLLENNIEEIEVLKKNIYYLNSIFYGLIVFKAFLVILSILILRKTKSILKFIGGSYLAAGFILFLASTLIKFAFGAVIQKIEFPLMLGEQAILRIFADALAPINMYNIVIAGVGILLLALSFIKFSTKKEQSEPLAAEIN